MKGVAYIFALNVLFLSVYPCSDSKPGLDERKAGIAFVGQVTALPDEAIIDFRGKKYIFVPTEGKQGEDQHFTMIEIQDGNHEQGYTEVMLPDGFDDSKEIVVKGAYSILSKIKTVKQRSTRTNSLMSLCDRKTSNDYVTHA